MLAKAEDENKEERYKRMLRGTIKRLEGEFKNKERELDGKRTIGVEYDEIACGVLEVIKIS